MGKIKTKNTEKSAHSVAERHSKASVEVQDSLCPSIPDTLLYLRAFLDNYRNKQKKTIYCCFLLSGGIMVAFQGIKKYYTSVIYVNSLRELPWVRQ